MYFVFTENHYVAATTHDEDFGDFSFFPDFPVHHWTDTNINRCVIYYVSLYFYALLLSHIGTDPI